ncbi:MAG TPA: YajG family lipoprotein [Deltaproteobacteria bacterium]|jgi:hypothetical protein|nr:YajG family lipoprotein [Deltaproteobacteria bacterium]HQB38450.1 YajG family lipoprotein [Deltaproteobacteria bacterium]
MISVMLKRSLATGLLFAMTAITGCSTVDQSIMLRYSSAAPAPVSHSGEIVITRTDPQQTRKATGDWVVGSFNNVYGVRQADVISGKGIADWISEALLLELKQAGYTARMVPALPKDARYGIHLSEINAFLNVNKGTVSSDTKHELKFNVDLFLNGTRVKSFTVASRDKQTVPLSISQEKMEQIMLKSLQDAMQQLMPEITALTARK